MPSVRSRSRLRVAGALALLLAATPLQAEEAAGAADGRPKASYPTFLHDFGKAAKGEKLSHAFVVRNEGTAPLEIHSVHPT